MLLSGGKHRGQRILSRPSAEMITTDQLARPEAVSGLWPGYFDNRGWGFGLAVVTRRDHPPSRRALQLGHHLALRP